MHVATITRTKLAWVAAAVALCLALLVGAEAQRLTGDGGVSFPLDDRRTGIALLTGFHAIERDARSTYRWTMGEGRAVFAAPGSGSATALRLTIGSGVPGGTASDLSVTAGATAPVVFTLAPEPRVYQILLPPGAARAGNLDLKLASATASVAPDPRSVGVRLERISAHDLGPGVVFPAPTTALFQAVILAATGLIILRVGLPWLTAVAAVALAAALLALLPHRYELFMPIYLARLAVAWALLAGLTFVALPLLERRPAWLGPPAEARTLWGVAALASAIRLAGALYPPFAAYDLFLNLDRLMATVGGVLVATNESFEFGGGVTVYPSGPYVVLMPGMLAGLTPKLAVQGGISLLDGLAALGVAGLGRALGLRYRVVLFACLAYAAVPINMSTLYHGHTAQAFGQALMAPLAVALLLGMRGASSPWPWLVAWALFSAALLSHIGVTILALAWLGLAWLALTATRRLDGQTWRRLTLTLFLGGLVGLTLVYGPTVASHLSIVANLDFGEGGVAPAPAYNLIAKAWWISFSPLGLLLAVAALPLTPWRRLPAGAAELIGAWATAVALFWAVEMVSGLQVRYLVFLVPLACLLAGLALDWLAARGGVGRLAAWVLAWSLVVQGAWVWFPGAFERIAPSMVMLLR